MAGNTYKTKLKLRLIDRSGIVQWNLQKLHRQAGICADKWGRCGCIRQRWSISTVRALSLPVTNFVTNAAPRRQDTLLQRLSRRTVTLLKFPFDLSFGMTFGLATLWNGPKPTIAKLLAQSLSGFCVRVEGCCQLLVVLNHFWSCIFEIRNKRGIMITFTHQRIYHLIFIQHIIFSCIYIIWIFIIIDRFGHESSLIIRLELGPLHPSYVLEESSSKHTNCTANPVNWQITWPCSIGINKDLLLVVRRQIGTSQSDVCLKVRKLHLTAIQLGPHDVSSGQVRIGWLVGLLSALEQSPFCIFVAFFQSDLAPMASQNLHKPLHRLAVIDHELLLVKLQLQESRSTTVQYQTRHKLCILTYRPCFQQQTYLLCVDLQIIFGRIECRNKGSNLIGNHGQKTCTSCCRWLTFRHVDRLEQHQNPKSQRLQRLDLPHFPAAGLRYQCEWVAIGSQSNSSPKPCRATLFPRRMATRSPMEVTAESAKIAKGCPHPKDRASSLADMAQAMPLPPQRLWGPWASIASENEMVLTCSASWLDLAGYRIQEDMRNHLAMV